MSRIFVGIDPDSNGGWCAIDAITGKYLIHGFFSKKLLHDEINFTPVEHVKPKPKNLKKPRKAPKKPQIHRIIDVQSVADMVSEVNQIGMELYKEDDCAFYGIEYPQARGDFMTSKVTQWITGYNIAQIHMYFHDKPCKVSIDIGEWQRYHKIWNIKPKPPPKHRKRASIARANKDIRYRMSKLTSKVKKGTLSDAYLIARFTRDKFGESK